MWMMIGKTFLSLTYAISIVSFPHVSCSKSQFKRCLEKELSDILKVVAAARTKDNQVVSRREIVTSKEVDDMMGLILKYLSHGDIEKLQQLCRIPRKINGPNRKFFFWPWRPWVSSWQSSQTSKPPYGAGIFGGISGPLGLGIGAGLGVGINYPFNQQPGGNTDYEVSGNPQNQNTNNFAGFPPLPNGNGIGYDRFEGTNTYNGFGNKGNDRPLSGDKYSSYNYLSGANEYDYNDYNGGKYPSSYNQYVGNYYPTNGMDTKNNWYSKPGTSGSNRYPGTEQRNDGVYNQHTNTRDRETKKEDHDFYLDPGLNSQEVRVKEDDHQFYWDGGYEDKGHDPWWGQNGPRVPSRTDWNIRG